MEQNQTPEKYKLYLHYDSHDETIEDTYGEDGPYTGYCESTRHFTPKYITIAPPSGEPLIKYYGHYDVFYTDIDPTDVKKLWVVVVRYTDGGTFGCTHGLTEICGAFTDDDKAYELAAQIKDRKLPRQVIMFGGRETEAPHAWEGYFSSLDDVEVHRLEVKP